MGRIATTPTPTTATWEAAGTAPATVSDQTISIGYYTNDGTHPTPSGHKAIAATVNAAAL